MGLTGKTLMFKMKMDELLAPGERVEFDFGGDLRRFFITSAQIQGFILPVPCSLFNSSVFLTMTD